jgi:tRNA(fMet)-specific endonuclease VapC
VTHLLDTNICSAHMRHPAGLAHRFFQYAGGIAIPTVVLAELYAGAHKHPQPAKLLALIADLLQEVAVLDFDSACAARYGETQGGLLRQGIMVPVAD